MIDDTLTRALDFIDDTRYSIRLRCRHLLARVSEATIGRSMFGVTRWNTDKPHRCPQCHAVTIDDRRPTGREVYACCRCGTRFTRWSALSPLLVERGVVCTEHRWNGGSTLRHEGGPT